MPAMGRIPHVRSLLSDPLYGLRRRIERVDDRLDLLGGPSAPSSGIAISRAKAVMLETPGMLVRMAKRSARLAFASIIWRIAASTVAICRSILLLDKGAY